MRGVDGDEPVHAVDMNALLESLQADAEQAGQQMEIEGVAPSPYLGRPHGDQASTALSGVERTDRLKPTGSEL